MHGIPNWASDMLFCCFGLVLLSLHFVSNECIIFVCGFIYRASSHVFEDISNVVICKFHSMAMQSVIIHDSIFGFSTSFVSARQFPEPQLNLSTHKRAKNEEKKSCAARFFSQLSTTMNCIYFRLNSL